VAGLTTSHTPQKVRALRDVIEQVRNTKGEQVSCPVKGFTLQEAGGWASMAIPRRYIEDAQIANEGMTKGV